MITARAERERERDQEERRDLGTRAEGRFGNREIFGEGEWFYSGGGGKFVVLDSGTHGSG